ncbi:MAG: PIN domain-containing protein [Lachnospiraceae bacterium]|nr:PIN domain-containing protein [Lachnospiraceae bacterium]
MKLLDTNSILRYLLGDIQEQQLEAKAVIDSGAFTLPEVLAEVVYVLTGYYEETRDAVFNSLMDLLNDVQIEHKEAITEALNIYHDTSLDFVDCILIGRNHVLGDDVFSFDTKLNKKLIMDSRS